MVAGLRERARLHDLLGRHVGVEVLNQFFAAVVQSVAGAPTPDGWVSAGSVALRGFAQPTAVYEA